MQYSIDTKVGKIMDFDGFLGKITTEDKVFVFSKNEIINDENINNGDLVVFKGKSEKEFPQAYYVKKLTIKQTK